MNATVLQSDMSLLASVRVYLANIRNFEFGDWLRYLGWIGMLFSLFLGVTSFLMWGYLHGVTYPSYVWFIPFGTGMFLFALSIDDIGHRTLYKQHLRKGEAYVHQMIAITAVTSVMALCLCYEHGEAFRTPALVLIFLSFFYSIIDEALHWHRYLTHGVDRVEMWSHFVAISGHALMIACWWQWYNEGYLGVRATVESFPW